MSIGLGIVLVVIGAILLFAIEVEIPGIDDDALGWILILAGLLTVVLSLVMANAGRRRRSVVVTEHRDGTVSESERRTDGGPVA